ncbi:MAG: hypothetical protein E7420_02760 [Ruminococcaceae bacterium]|nr:hypothetical protein [Oscillospiraceae bacterium]
MKRFNYIIITFVIALVLALVLVCTLSVTDNKKSYDLDNLLSEIDAAKNNTGVIILPFIEFQHFQIQNRVFQYNEVSTYGVELKDYLGEKYSDSIRTMKSSAPVQTEQCTLYHIKNENNLSYFIKEGSDGLLSLWEYNIVFEYNGHDFDEIVKIAFPDANVDLATKEEINKIIYGTNASD